MNVVNYPGEDLNVLATLAGLKCLQLTSRRLVSLAGIDSLQGLITLDLAYCPKLGSLTGIERCQKLQMVELKNCKKVGDVSCLGELLNLRELFINDCGTIRSLQPLAKCRHLENLIFYGDTNIEDGDLATILEIPKLKKMWFADRSHYSHKRDQISAAIS
ncbi:hypothetical protein J4E05_16550 [Thalassospira sp. NFXS8]|uniref:hypothetical protein n=1 Tax=Thalassospira sp. NFXS8 TaxID=2819093 RepID=UPI0032DEB954